ncbi:N-acetyl-gamma-glutamyl-phosphate reductase [Hydrogenibacillus sp. N12]|uniref:N-acetyl-gamma-glutamyl-phosphate reductase n=1 Tax=Hydrogenibacillus sp. N12 TaxID=2866627 RepID=UPI001C7CE448|nr:N-acetyl-gamma-glutamyl-phosphate reductase [Hydrogenibacillus sp. N12]QZA32074.1 N-acetyl-gamma-glutamyl-phosphate reductase [Hydrogenibacillus sp. N12]
MERGTPEPGAPLTVAVVGTGYGSAELLRLLLDHPRVGAVRLYTHSREGEAIDALYPHLAGFLDVRLRAFDPAEAAAADVVFFGTPHGASAELVPPVLERGGRVIDLSGDFRLQDGAAYEAWYGLPAAPAAWREAAAYGLADVYGEALRGARLIANPGCYPTAALLALVPLLRAGTIEPDGIVLDGKSGVSGAGRGVSLGVHFAEVNENLRAYKVGRHQHVPEIEEEAARWAGGPVRVTFVPHLVPMTRGILMTVYARWRGAPTDTEGLVDLYRKAYSGKPFVRVLPAGRQPETKHVAGTNLADLGAVFDGRSGTAIVTVAIDNLVKGAAGQAVQNMNLLFGWPETLGLRRVPLFP